MAGVPRGWRRKYDGATHGKEADGVFGVEKTAAGNVLVVRKTEEALEQPLAESNAALEYSPSDQPQEVPLRRRLTLCCIRMSAAAGKVTTPTEWQIDWQVSQHSLGILENSVARVHSSS